jgi:PTH1 family peptidyl-tRNA hydrolase
MFEPCRRLLKMRKNRFLGCINRIILKYLVVGLGNIGPEYADTRHNIGFMVVDELVAAHANRFSSDRYAYISQLGIRNRQVFVIKPTTFMNLSGKAVNYWMQQFKIPVSNVLVVVDDLAIPFASVKLKPKGSDAGHNGLKSINASVGTSDYPRIRFGIGNNYPRGRQADYVLSGFDKEELPQLPELIHKSVQMIESFVTIGVELTMTKFN